MNKYIAFWGSKQYPIEAESQWKAVEKARAELKVPKSKQGLLSVVLVEVDGREITHSTAAL